MKLRDLVKLWIFKLFMKKSNFKKINHDFILVTLSSLHQRKTLPKQRHKIFQFWPPFPPIKISGYASDHTTPSKHAFNTVVKFDLIHML